MTRSRRAAFRFRPGVLKLEDRLNPNVSGNLYVSSTFAGLTDGTSVTFRPGKPDQVGGLSVGTDAFATLQSAFDVAPSGDTIFVDEGSYLTPALPVRSRTLTVSGVSEADTTIHPSEDMSALFSVGQSGTLNLAQFTIGGRSDVGLHLGAAVRYDSGSSGGWIDTVQFRNVSGVGVLDLAGNVTVDSCRFNNMGTGGVRFDGGGHLSALQESNYYLQDNTITDEVAVSVAPGANVLVSGNTITSTTIVSASSVGVQFQPGGTQTTELTLVGNQIQNCGVGLKVLGTTTDLVTFDVHYNNFIDNKVQVSTSGPSFDAANCWWGGTTANPTAPPSITSPPPPPVGNVTTSPPAVPANQVRFAVSSSDYAREIAQSDANRRHLGHAVGSGPGGLPLVEVRPADPAGRPVDFLAYDAKFTGGVRTASAASGDDLLAATAPGPGGGPHVKVFRFGSSGAPVEVFSKMAYDPSFTGGVWVALGDVNGDGLPDLVTGTGPGGGPHVKVFDGATGLELASYFVGDPADRGGVTVAVGDVDGDGRGEVITGSWGGSTVRILDALTGHVVGSFAAFEPSFNGGVSVAAADLTGDGKADVLVGAGAGGGPVVKGFTAGGKQLWAHLAYDASFTGGVNVDAADVDGNGRVELVTGPGPGGAPHLRAFDLGSHAEVLGEVLFDPESRGGLNV